MTGRHYLRPGDHFIRAPPDDQTAEAVPLARGHPGLVSEPAGDLTVSVAWVDCEGPLALEGAFDVAWLVPVSAEDFEARAVEVRDRRRAREEAGRVDGRAHLPRPD